MIGDALAMAVPALAVSSAVPAAIRVTRHRPVWGRLLLPCGAAFGLFAAVHAGVSVADAVLRPAPAVRLALLTALLGSAVLFWVPVLHPARRLSDAGRCVYLYLAGSALDLPAVAIISLGDGTGGLAMIVGMLPVGGAALAVTWRWIVREERAQRAAAPRHG